MQTPSAHQLLHIWEAGQGRPPWVRALLLLEAAETGMEQKALARLPLGERDDRLLELRARLFGETLSSLADCPACGERLELNFSIDDVRLPGPKATAFLFESGDLCVSFRLPDSVDLEALLPGPDAPRALLEACLQGINREGEPAVIADLNEAEITALIAHMGEADPRADLKAAMNCPNCSHSWSARFDILSFLWEELGAWVRRLLAEVHVLARAYGWREDDVLALSPWRRQHYIEWVQS
ncbi:hypothetical protein [Halomonas sp. BM-2019]|uniref:T4 family baseplate hub assembly chaperone n=1 Tax=Halomonas sp. BM-2019 TaxID=2811227 RepID=UPI001B3C2F23|nr:MAG: hypothetical protein J5F18_18955 [Halomonas sp. BM-2019]